MRKLNLSVLICILLAASFQSIAQRSSAGLTSKQISAAERELRKFYDDYAEDLRQHRREAIAGRYDLRGVYLMGNGRKNHNTFESVKNRYLTKWNGPKSFEWKDLSFEVLSSNSAVVLGRFEWETPDGKKSNYSYTGVLVKRSGKWLIRVEDESSAL